MYLENLRQELAELEISIAGQRVLLQELEKRKSTVRAELDAFIFPVLTLPNEITTEIFIQYAFDKDYWKDRFPCLAVHLLSVCRAWRALALSVPALWVTLDLRARGELEGFVDTWFSRAGTLPLSLDWDGSTVKPWSGRLNAIIHQYAPRLESLHLRISKGCVSHLTHSMPFPLLQDLDLSNPDVETSPAPLTTPVLTFREAPRLRRVALEHISPASLMPPWGLLQTFCALEITPQECLDVLRAAPLLRKLEFYGCSTNNPFNNDEPVVFHPRLTSFRLCNQSQEIMQYLALSALDVLYFGAFQGLDDDIFVPFLTRTRGSLQKFTLSHYKEAFVLPMSWLRHMMHLTDLDLHSLEPES
ncbi:hypothetical protein B0H19DRAFT_1238507 [Mycena capillaripes]|nr:hypothetical protein B0H19DRAFT_1238507 [Mycena capillaripes]